MHSLVHGTARIETFVFGTRLTRITPALRDGDLDTAVARASELVLDWSGGTRIGESLRSFNYRWSRRVSGHGAVALIISDGWDRGDQDVLGVEIRRLRRNVHRLIWLNPLAGSPSYQPLVRGIQTILPARRRDAAAAQSGKHGAVGGETGRGQAVKHCWRVGQGWVYCGCEDSPSPLALSLRERGTGSGSDVLCSGSLSQGRGLG
ncbi:MAG: VWA domain-containing protein [Anaerolineales bacterium]|nr:VWA domain-containing protein [Anaerolineales bacterium]